MIGDKGYDDNPLHAFLAERGTAAVIPSARSCQGRHTARRRPLQAANVFDQTFCRFKDHRGTATRYDKTARDILAAPCLVSAITDRARLRPVPGHASPSGSLRIVVITWPIHTPQR